MNDTRIIYRWSIPTLAALLLAACGGGGGDKAPTQPGGGGSGGTTPVLTSIAINAPANVVAVGATLQLTATPRDQFGSAMTASITWSAQPSTVASVSTQGLVTGLNAGIATVVASSGSVNANTTITVTGGGTFPLSATVTMPGNTFSPFQADIARTGTVSFVFGADAHNVIFSGGSGVPSDIQITQNATVNRQFNTVGSFPYVCTLHPGMAGTVVVH